MRLRLQSFIEYSLFGLFLMIQLGCSESRPKEDQVKDSLQEKALKKTKPGSSFSDTIRIDSPAAVFYFPDSLQLEKLRAINDSGIFKSIMHDCFYQMRYSRNVLKQYYKHVLIIEVKNARYLVFIKINGEKEYVDLNTQNDACGLFIFDPRKSHQWVDMTNAETAFGFYFTK